MVFRLWARAFRLGLALCPFAMIQCDDRSESESANNAVSSTAAPDAHPGIVDEANSDASPTDIVRSTNRLLDASRAVDAATSDAALAVDASAQCTCVKETITWSLTGGISPGRIHRLTPACEFSYSPLLSWDPMCSTQISPCATRQLQTALELPGVQQALDDAPVAYGNAPTLSDDNWQRIEIGDRIIDIGRPCPAGKSCAIPDDINALYLAVASLANEQLVRSPCREMFTANAQSCEDRRDYQENLPTYVDDSACETVSDCATINLSTECSSRCPIAVRSHYTTQLEVERAFMDSRFCDGYAADCNVDPIPECTASTAACVDGQCVVQ